MKHIYIFGIFLCIVVSFVSCNAKDDPNALLDTQFAAEVIDSSHILSPKTYSYLHNVKPPLGVKPVVVVVDKINNSQMGTYADDLFDHFCEKKYSGNTFRKRGILIVASKSPELVQVRVGKTYDVYCRMRGSAAGADYLSMQKECSSKGLNEMCPVALRNVVEDIEQCRELPWYKKLALKVSFMHVDILMKDLATPSKSFFSQFYFHPFLFVVGGVKSIFGSWVLSFLFIAIVYTLLKYWAEDKINAFCAFLIKLVITVPTLAAISFLSSARMEDIIALNDAHIPTVGLVENITQWSNNIPELWFVLILMVVYYVNFLFYKRGDYIKGHLSDVIQQYSYHNNSQYRNTLDKRIAHGYNRRLIQGSLGLVFKHLPLIASHDNIHEIDSETVYNDTYAIDENGKPKKQFFDIMFLDSDDSLYRSSPALALQVNSHREALYLSFFVGLLAISILSFTYVLYFLILWLVQLIYRIVREYVYAKKNWGNHLHDFNPLRLVRIVWVTDFVFLATMAMLLWILTPPYTPKTIDTVVEVQKAFPEDLIGLYFVPKADGEDVRGVTARIVKGDDDNYYLQVYSDKPMRRIGMTLDKEYGIFHSDILGNGYITYDKQTKSIKINFSDLWILTN